MRVALPLIDIEVTRRRKKPAKDVEVTAEFGQMVTDAQRALDQRHLSWRTYDEYYIGEQKINKGVDHSEAENRDMHPLNYCMSTVETIIPILIDAAPMWFVLDETVVEGSPLVEEVTHFMQAFWHHVKMDLTLEEISRDTVVYGTGIGKVYWDSEKTPVDREMEIPEAGIDEFGDVVFETESEIVEDHLGDVSIEWCDPFSVFPDPNARTLDECRYVAIKVEISKEDLMRQFDWLDEDDIAMVGGTDRQRIRPREQEEDRQNLAEVWEIYHEFGKKLIIYTGSTILYDDANPTPGGKFPIVLFLNRRRGGWLWGQSAIGDIMATQDVINLTHVHIATNMRYGMDPQLRTNDPKLKEHTNKPGQVLYVEAKIKGNPGFAEWQDIKDIPASLFTLLDRLQRTLDVQSGVHDVMEGVKPKGVTSGIALAQLAEGAQGRVRLLIRSMAISIEDVGQLVLAMMMANYAEPRTIASYGGDGPTATTLGLENLPSMGGGKYRVIVQSRGDLPLNPAAQLDIAIQLFGAGAIDQAELLKIAQWPDREAIGQRMEDAAMSQMAGMAQGGATQQLPEGAAPGAV